MSTTKRTRGRPSEAGANPSLPPNKKAKTSNNSHVQSSGLAFLTDENKRAGKRLSANSVNGVKDAKSARVDESKAVVGSHETDTAASKDVVEISSGESESSEYESSGDEAGEEDVPKQLTNGASEGDAEAGADDVAMADADNDDNETGPSFGDLLQASHPDTIDVQAAFAGNPDAQSLMPIDGNRVLTAPSATSLGTVLTQALRTNDKDLLESCFQTRDTPSIRSTIERLQSPLVADLLQRLAERLYKRPGRAGSLMVWVQWSLVAHGGYLAGQPQVLKKLKALSQVVKERASGLQSLITLKGKLDMLGAQLELRQAIQDKRAGMFNEDEEDPNVIYIEGEDDDESSEDEMDEDQLLAPRKQKKITSKQADSESEAEDIEDLPITNGVAESDDESEQGDDDDLEGGLIDDMAEVTSDEEGEDSEDDDEEDDDMSEEDVDDSASEEEGPPPTKAPKPQRSSIRRR